MAAAQKQQSDQYNRAMQAFHQRDFKKAKELFAEAAEGPVREMAFAAKTHLKMCEQRLAKVEVKLETPEEAYNYAVALMNRRDYSGAVTNLELALRSSDADHYHYALAIAQWHAGAQDKAVEHFRRALALQPRTRSQALTDPDFSELARHPQIRELLQK